MRWKFQRYLKNYLRCIRGVDESVGRIVDWLEQNELAENTIVVYSSDQGFYLGDHGWYDKRWMYEESLAMPLIVHWPGNTAPGSVEIGLSRTSTTLRPSSSWPVSPHRTTCKGDPSCSAPGPSPR